MSETTLTFYAFQKAPLQADYWPLGLADVGDLQVALAEGAVDFEDDVAEPIEAWAEDHFVAQYIVQLDLSAFQGADQYGALLAGLQHGLLLAAEDMDFISQVDNDQLLAMINQLLSLSLPAWDLDEDLTKEETEVADLVGFLAACKMRGHSLLGVASNS